MAKALKMCKTCTISKSFHNIQLSWKHITLCKQLILFYNNFRFPCFKFCQ
jgi:hypothetical protein